MNTQVITIEMELDSDGGLKVGFKFKHDLIYDKADFEQLDPTSKKLQSYSTQMANACIGVLNSEG